ncbi:MAG: type 1 glutamine amidotransferase domain-containing protein [Pseudomonadota bacterium]
MSTLNKRILMIATSHAVMGNTGRQTGVWAEELAAPYFIFSDAGVEVQIASPLGGKLPFDPSSLKPAGQNEVATERFLADPAAQAKAGATIPVASVDATQFDAVFFPGGHGAMWDLPGDAGVTRAVEAAFAAHKIVASVCHGAAGLVTAKRADGQSILSGKQVNAFTDEEESATGLTEIVPFMLETRMRALGGQFQKAPNWQSFAVRDGQLITGQNPSSSVLVAQKVLAAFGE